MTRQSTVMIWILGFTFLVGCGSKEIPVTPLLKARQLLSKQDFAGARAHCDAMLASDSKNLEAMLFRAEVYEKEGNLEKAIEDCTQAIVIAPSDPEAYRLRSSLYYGLADQASDEDEVWRLRGLASADNDAMEDRDPLAKATLGKIRREPSPILSREVPEFTGSPDAHDDVEKMMGDTDLELVADENGEKPVGEGDGAEEAASGEAEENPLVESPQDYAARTSRDAEIIRQKELMDGLPEPVLPPHLDPTAELPPVPESPITRFNLPATPEGGIMMPNRGNAVATGIRPPADSEGDESENEDARTPLNRFYLQNQFGLSREGVRTGIGSSASTSQRGNSATRPQASRLQFGLLPPDARDSFGPRIGTPAGSSLSTRFGIDAGDAVPPSPAVGSPVLTTALPGTTIFYGGANGAAGLSNARGGNMTGLTGNPNRFSTFADPKLTDFGKRKPAAVQPRPNGRGSNGGRRSN